MLPSILSREIKTGIRRFLQSMFPCSTPLFEGAVERLLDEPEAVFKGPYYGMRLPFQSDDSGRNYFERVRYPYRPHRHQALAFERLAGDTPVSTMVATGTGSGKTECFLYPVLDHCARRHGQGGIKAIIIYPMNALATDQSKRFAAAVEADPALRDRVRVGMYVGGDGEKRSVMMPEGVITDRAALRNEPPDILLTNYKMLDYLLIRPDDLPLWKENDPETLKFLVVDELHTFDGAQATDLGCLLRRLRARLRTPENHLCYVGTSATIGSGDQEADLLEYAGQLFGAPIDEAGAVIREHVLSQSAFMSGLYIKHAGLPGREDAEALRPLNFSGPLDYLRAQYRLWFGREPLDGLESVASRVRLGRELREHSVLRNLLQFFAKRQEETGRRHVPEDELLQEFALFHEDLQDRDLAYQVFDSLCSLCGHARFEQADTKAVFPLLKIDVHLWFRELSRMVATVEGGPIASEETDATNAGSDHDPKIRFSTDLQEDEAKRCLPVIHCRECGSMGWGALQRANDDHLAGNLDKFYQAFFGRDPKLRYVYPAAKGGDGAFPEVLCGHCFHIHNEMHPFCKRCGQNDRLVPVRIHQHATRDGDELRADPACPHCGSQSGVTILGSRSASLSSAALGQAFATRFNDDKQTLAFSDNVQDASHRASFFAARTYRTTLRTAISEVLAQSEGRLTLDRLERDCLDYWSKRLGPEDFVGTFLAPNMEWIEDYETLRREGRLPPESSVPKDVERRFAWEIVAEFGYQSRIGRTLEKSAVAIAYCDPDEVAGIAEKLRERLREIAGGFGSMEQEALCRFLEGLLHRLRTIGGIAHGSLNTYFEEQGTVYSLNRQRWAPGFSYKGRSPSAFAIGSAPVQKLERVVSTGSTPSWLEAWAGKSLPVAGGLSKEAAGIVIEAALGILAKAGLLEEGRARNGNRFWLIRKDHLIVSQDVRTHRCQTCGHTIERASEELPEGGSPLPCLRSQCGGHYLPGERRTDYFGELYRTGDVVRIHAEEHTALIERKEREWIERRFTAREDKRTTDPNLLSCTPTLEMGIDIGDLSTVLLCSVPPEAANYIQRVGRAGRRDGNAFSLTVANAQAHDLYFYGQPEEMMDGEVRAPGVFFNAPAVLERQFLAYCFDSWIAHARPRPTIPDTVGPALANVYRPTDPPTGFPYDLLDYARENRATLLPEFFALFDPLLKPEAIEALKTFVHGEGILADSLESRVVKRLRTLADEMEDLKKRRTEVLRRIRILERITPIDEATATEIETLQQTRKGLSGIIKTIRETKTLNFFTDEGLLPNYAFPEEGVTLRSIILRKKEKKSRENEGNYTAETLEYQRPAASAIRELAPGSSFYAQHRKLTVDQVNLRLSEPELWNFCDQCAHIERVDTGKATLSACPVCGSSGWADTSMRRWMIPLRQVVTTEFDRSSRAHDDADERTPQFFDSQTSVAIPAGQVEKAYRVKSSLLPFGFEFIRQATLRMVNLGPPNAIGETGMLAGRERNAKGFHLCPACGKVKGARKHDNKFRHDIVCPDRDKDGEGADLPAYFLYRELTSEALRILIPTVEADQNLALDSFVAALRLGLEKHFRGNIDHLASCVDIRPLPDSTLKQTFLVVYDKVPGGTGYLKELATVAHASSLRTLDDPNVARASSLRPETNHKLEACATLGETNVEHASSLRPKFLSVLHEALRILKECRCKDDLHLDGCHRCVRKHQRRGGSGDPSRATAIDILEQILSHGDDIEEIRTIGTIDLNPLIESQLEKRFLESLAAVPGATLKSELISGKNGYLLSLGEARWEIIPQWEIGKSSGVIYPTRPDFAFFPLRRKDSPPIAVYLDGFAYHAEEATGNNRVALDIAKREGLRRSGDWLVWSLTWEDLSQGSLVPAPPFPGGSESQFNRRATVLGTLSQRAAMRFQSFGAASSWRYLVDYLAAPAPDDFALNAYCLGLAVASLQPVSAPEVERCFAELTRPEAPPAFHLPATEGSSLYGYAMSEDEGRWLLAASTELEALRKKSLRGLHLLIRFEDAQALERDLFHTPWRGLLHLHNLLQFLPGVRFVTTRSLIQGLCIDTDFATDEQDAATSPTGQTGGWQLDRSLLHEDLHALAAALEEAGISEPVCGYELMGPDGTVVAEAELAWESKRCAILTQDQSDQTRFFEEQSWTIHLFSDALALSVETLKNLLS